MRVLFWSKVRLLVAPKPTFGLRDFHALGGKRTLLGAAHTSG
jgi:hypothetical protein